MLAGGLTLPAEGDIMEQSVFIATAAFGLEGVVTRELTHMGFDAKGENGGARFHADLAGAMRANLWLRTADRVLLEAGTFEALSFEALFEGVRSLPWERWIGAHSRFPVTGNCARSQLMSVRDCQSIIKKAIVERLKARYRLTWLPEDGETTAVTFQLHENRVRLCLDSSGTALNRRGYRTWNGEAPLRETLAAALVDLSGWRSGLPLYDPMCGTGTLLAEAAMRMADRAPGLTRSFDLERWPGAPVREFERLRAEAKEAFHPERACGIAGSDIDPAAVDLAGRHLRAAGFGNRIPLHVADMRACAREEQGGVFLTNPPYGERLGDRKACEALYRDLGQMAARHPTWSLSAISSHPGFERCFGRRADKKRRFYNGRLECEFMTFRAREPLRRAAPADGSAQP